MNLDERLEALTQSLELTDGIQRNHEARMAQQNAHLDRTLTVVDQFAGIGRNRGRRIDGLENRA